MAWNAYYGLHIRSEAYRAEVENDLSLFFELPCDLGSIRGHTFDSRVFDDITLWLPGRRDRVFSCRRAIWHEKENGDERNELDLIDGVLILGTDRWQSDDYRQVFQSSLGHDFEDLNLHRVGMSGFEISFARSDVTILCRNTSGTIDMSDPDDGIAHLRAYELNGYHIRQGVAIYARFSPENGVEVSEFVLTLPEVPLASVGIGAALNGNITAGTFAGQIEYNATKPQPEVWLRGELLDVNLEEMTSALPLGPFSGRLSISVDWAKVVDSVVTRFRGRGTLTDFSFAPFAPLLGLESLSGSATFSIDPADLALGHVNRLRLDGHVDDLTLEQLLHPLGAGSATGKLAVRINHLDIADDNIRAADIEVYVVPPADGPGTIDQDLLLTAAERLLDFSWPEAIPKRLLPEKVEYAEFGVRLLVRDNQLRVLGTHGPDGKTVLTIIVFGKRLGLVTEPSGTIDLGPVIDDVLARIRSYDPDRVREWWHSESHLGFEGP